MSLAEQEKRIPHIAQATAKAGTWVVVNLEAYRNIALQVEDLDSALKREGVKYVIPDIAPRWRDAARAVVGGGRPATDVG